MFFTSNVFKTRRLIVFKTSPYVWFFFFQNISTISSTIYSKFKLCKQRIDCSKTSFNKTRVQKSDRTVPRNETIISQDPSQNYKPIFQCGTLLKRGRLTRYDRYLLQWVSLSTIFGSCKVILSNNLYGFSLLLHFNVTD